VPSSDDATRKLRSGSREPLLRVEGLSVELPLAGGSLRAVDGVDLRLLRGQTLAVVGEAGAGKSTLAGAILGAVPRSAGKVVFDGKDLGKLGGAELHEALSQMRQLTRATFAGPDALAAATAREPKLLVFDEAFDDCDAAACLRIFSELQRLQDERGLSCLVLTRSLALARALSDQVLVMLAGQVVETGRTVNVVDQPQHPYTRSLSERSPLGVAGQGVASGCRFRMRCPLAFARCAEEVPALSAVPGGLCRCFLHDPDAPER
jgi:peptide/nickel transport system ATP-binding protein